jgi:hypothetical protein
MYKILYLRNEYDGPRSGICKKSGNLYWFVCTSDLKSEPDQRFFDIYQIEDEMMKTYITEHIESCIALCKPVKYGDPQTTFQQEKIVKYEFANDEGRIYEEGKKIATIETKDFSNYYVIHEFKHK